MGSGSTLDGVVSGIEVSNVTLGSVLMSSCSCGTSSLKAYVPEMIGVTVVSDDVETKVSNKPDELDSVMLDRFTQNGFVSRVKDG